MEHGKLATLHIRRADLGLLRDLLGRVPRPMKRGPKKAS